MKKYFAMILMLHTLATAAVQISIDTKNISRNNKNITFHFKLDKDEAILQNSIITSIDSPQLYSKETKISIPATKKYIHEFQQTKSVYDQNFDVNVEIESRAKTSIDGSLYISYLSTQATSIAEKTVPIKFSTEKTIPSIKDRALKPMPKPYNPQVEANELSWTAKIQNLVENSSTPWMRILLALLLGLLLSLTPCIYPMIPITIGILHSHGKKSLLHNLAGSLCYAMGLATTFSILGLLAATAGNTFGSLLSQPVFVICLVLFIGYMSMTMIGIFDMYTPSFMKGQAQFYTKLGPFFAAFMFGAISGTIASPCISPGLALLLSIVATLGNKILGLALLFAFGIGMSTPLIIVGTFSNTLHMLPQSGMWMVEIKKLLGFVMLATCFYYLSNIMPPTVIAWLMVAYSLFAAIFYLIDGQKSHGSTKTFKTFISVSMVAITLLMTTKAYEKTFYKQAASITISVPWQKNYDSARSHAQKNHNILLLDFWANHCTICKAIDKKIFQNSKVKTTLEDKVTFLKIDATDVNDPEYQKLKHQYNVHAQPAILLIDPTTEKVILRWSSEPYSMTIEEFINTVQKSL